jgi:transaldolase
MNPILQATDIGQSFWLDYIRRDILFNGDLAAMIGSGEVRGVTSNPSIFDKAIAGSDLYSSSLRSLAQAGLKPAEAFDILAIDDIRAATDLFMPLFEQTNGGDGYVSIEVNPRLADDTPGTLEEASRLWQTVNRPNVMIKIPATAAGVPAIEQAISQGININVTLIFSLQRYTEVMEAYLRGLEQRMEAGQSLDHIASVASFFVSRVDTKVDQRLEEIIRTEERDAERATSLLGKIAIAKRF